MFCPVCANECTLTRKGTDKPWAINVCGNCNKNWVIYSTDKIIIYEVPEEKTEEVEES